MLQHPQYEQDGDVDWDDSELDPEWFESLLERNDEDDDGDFDD